MCEKKHPSHYQKGGSPIFLSKIFNFTFLFRVLFVTNSKNWKKYISIYLPRNSHKRSNSGVDRTYSFAMCTLHFLGQLWFMYLDFRGSRKKYFQLCILTSLNLKIARTNDLLNKNFKDCFAQPNYELC